MQPQGTPKRAALYPRVSSKKQEIDGFGLDYQERLAREYVAKQGWVVVEDHVYREAFTGTLLDERPELSKLRAAVPTGAFDVVVAYDIDRVQREDWFYGYLRDEWKPYGVRWKFVTEPHFDSDHEEENWRDLTGMLAKWKKRDQLRKTNNGRVERGRQGCLSPGGWPLYGYRYVDHYVDAQGKEHCRPRIAYAIVEDEAAIVREAYQRLVDGASLNGIAADFNRRRIPTRRGGRWHATNVQRLVKNPAYKGQKQNFTSRGSHPMLDGVAPVTVDATVCPVIVTPELWAAAQPLPAQNKQVSYYNRAGPESAWFRGYAYCGGCGRRLRTAKPRGRMGTSYRCQFDNDGVVKCPAPATIVAANLDAAVVAELRRFFEQPIWLDRQAQHLQEQAAKIAEEIARIDDRLTVLMKKRTAQWELAEDAPRELRHEAMERLTVTTNEIAHWTAERETLDKRHAEAFEQRQLVADLAGGGVTYWPSYTGACGFDQMGYTQWQTVFRHWQPHVIVNPRGQTPRWRIELDAVDMQALGPQTVSIGSDPNEPPLMDGSPYRALVDDPSITPDPRGEPRDRVERVTDHVS